MKLGKLSKVELRAFWKHEASDFTRWLAEAENLSELGDEIGLEIDTGQVQTEAGVGNFSADILAQEENTGKKIVIENQLETTDHKHLGQILTYASGIEAEYIVWVAKEVRDEHKQAVDWLNEHTDEKLNFFLVKIELWRIGDSDLAPKFFVVSRPNNWTKSVRGSAGSPAELTETKLLQLEFWQQLKDYSAKQAPALKLRTPRAQHWYDVAIGRSDCHLSLTMLTSENLVGCELYIPNSKQLYQMLFARKEEIEKELSATGTLIWQELPGKKASRIRVVHKFDYSVDDKEAAFSWLLETCQAFKRTFFKALEPVQA